MPKEICYRVRVNENITVSFMAPSLAAAEAIRDQILESYRRRVRPREWLEIEYVDI